MASQHTPAQKGQVRVLGDASGCMQSFGVIGGRRARGGGMGRTPFARGGGVDGWVGPTPPPTLLSGAEF